MKTTAVFAPIVEVFLIAIVFVRLLISAELKTTKMRSGCDNAIPLQHDVDDQCRIKGV